MAMAFSRPAFGTRSPLALTLVLAAAISFAAGCEHRGDPGVPAHLIGVWKTDHPKYRDLFFQITSSQVIFNTVEGGLETYRIAGTESSAQGTTSAYTIYGERAGENLNFYLYYDTSGGGRLRFKNQIAMAWSKAKDGRS